MAKEQILMTTREVAELFRVDPSTVRQWCKLGRLTLLKTPGGRNRHYTVEVHQLYKDSEEKEG
jgi:excisionase family DNA binding protein